MPSAALHSFQPLQPRQTRPASARKYAASAALAALLLSAAACTPRQPSAPEPPPPPAPVVAVPLPSERPAYDADAVHALLEAAESALAEDRLLTPADDCAYLYFRRALELAPELPAALRGFERIVDRYLALAERAIARQRWAAVDAMLDRAASLDAGHPDIATLRRQRALLAGAERETLALDAAQLRARHADAARALAHFGAKARRPDARVTIHAATDADGRWIYEQLDKAPGSARIRGELRRGTPPRVVLVIFGAADGGA